MFHVSFNNIKLSERNQCGIYITIMADHGLFNLDSLECYIHILAKAPNWVNHVPQCLTIDLGSVDSI